ncbi:FAD/NAD(P)-binding domain-containing protein [Mytilinidion resinicola]|uniref:FAD/NAD(P)-binding domain-containing protein n=1 Tax=Mytilinidion resinicola TaxID=574789 RepID=A0A6A6YUY2_9PEZI|nr:FAD/NAD(P)-binding domain-containing protein [Mytilinidion resinicola]KAF2812358.1 FAD/NAD(P)-binding domain-containing protein [Mytilinidion resinicola]
MGNMNGHTSNEAQLKVLIIGAGPAGCAIAHGLKKNDISFSIFDRAKSVEATRHWAFTVGWSRPFLCDLLPEELANRLTECQVDPAIDCQSIGKDEIVIYDGVTKKDEFKFPVPGGKEINMRKIRTMCAENLDIQYNKKLLDIEYHDHGVTAHFDDGTSETGSILIGVDGASSQVRRCLLGRAAQAEVLPFVLMNFNTKYTAEQALFIKERLHPLVDIAINPSGHYIRLNVLDMDDRERPETWSFQILSTWAPKCVEDYDNETDRLKRLKEHFRRDNWAEPYRSAVEWAPDDTEVLRDQLKIWKTVPWENHGGRATLAGDAAHAMTFHRGQGANNAFGDAYGFVLAMKKVKSGEKTLKEAVDEYDSNVQERGAKEVQISKSQTFFTHDWAAFKDSPVMTMGTKPVAAFELPESAKVPKA